MNLTKYNIIIIRKEIISLYDCQEGGGGGSGVRDVHIYTYSLSTVFVCNLDDLYIVIGQMFFPFWL